MRMTYRIAGMVLALAVTDIAAAQQPRVPDSLLFTRQQRTDDGQVQVNVYRTNATGTRLDQITNRGLGVMDYEPSWSPNASHITFIRRIASEIQPNDPASGKHIYVKNMANGTETEIAAGGSLSDRTGLTWGPANQIAYITYDKTRNVHCVKAARWPSKSTRTLFCATDTSPEPKDYYPAELPLVWSRDGTTLYAQFLRTFGRIEPWEMATVFKINTRTGASSMLYDAEQQQLAGKPYPVFELQVSPNGNQAIGGIDGVGTVRIDYATGNTRKLPYEGGSLSSQYSHCGKYWAYVRNTWSSDGTPTGLELVIVNTTTLKNRVVPLHGEQVDPWLDSLIWSADDTKLIMPDRLNEEAVVIDSTTGLVTRIPTGEYAEHAWSPN